MLDQIDFCVKSHPLRPQARANLLASIQRFYPGVKPLVNVDPCIAKGRNVLVQESRAPFLLMLDDDFVFTAETDILRLYDLLSSDPSLGIVAGSVMDVRDGVRVPRNSGGMVTIVNGSLRLDAALGGGFIDVAPNFCLIRREVFDACEYRWGIGAEHVDFFLQVRDAGWKVWQIASVTIDHDIDAPALPGYKAARWDVGTNILRFLEHWNIDRVVVNGTVVHSRPINLSMQHIRGDTAGFAR